MWLAVASRDLESAREVLDACWSRDLTPLARASAELVVDLEADQTTCPACLAGFAPSEPRCPSCGLRFG